MTKIGARIIVVPNDASVLPIERLELPVPKLLPVPEEADTAAGNARGAVISAGSLSAQAVKVAAASPNARSAPARLLNPLERAKLIRDLAVADAAAKAKVARNAVAMSALKLAAAESAGAALRASELALAMARARRSAAAKVVERTPPQSAAEAEHALATADLKVAEAEKANEDARAFETAQTTAAIAVAKSASEAEQASREAAAGLKAAERGIEPISIFVSKKAGRVYIRQSWVPIYEAPVSFRDAEKPVGTHVYLAVASERSDENLRWLSASLSTSTQARPRTSVKALVQRQPVGSFPEF